MLGGARDSGLGSREERMTTKDARVLNQLWATEPRAPGPEPRHV